MLRWFGCAVLLALVTHSEGNEHAQWRNDRRAILEQPQCGLRFNDGSRKRSNIHPPPWKRIVGGIESEAGAWPWQVALLMDGTQMCGGSLISPDWVISAGHCFQGISSLDPKHWAVTLGEHHLKNRDWFEQTRKVHMIYLHPKYKESSVKARDHGHKVVPPDYDIALLRLAKPAKFDKFVFPICLLPQGAQFEAGKECYVTGWGHTQWKGPKPDILREAKVRLVHEEKCNSPQSYEGGVSGRSLCAGFEKGGVDSCQYDSGGPLACEDGGRWYLTGVVSWGHECGNPHKYGVYANMQVMNSWVREAISQQQHD